MVAGFAFGLIIGYLAWHSFWPREASKAVSLEKVAAFVGIVAGATILTLFPTGTEPFEAYCVGLAIGFFFTPVKQWNRSLSEAAKERMNQREKKRERKQKQEIDKIERDWPEIERFLNYKFKAGPTYMFKDGLARRVQNRDLQELQYSGEGITYIMRKYAQLHIEEGIKFDSIMGLMKSSR